MVASGKVTKGISIYKIKDFLLPGNPKAVYYLYGEDEYTLNEAIKEISEFYSSEILDEFDRETISFEKGQKIGEVLDIALAYPFSGGRKLIIAKNLELIRDKKDLANYISNPADFTILVLVHYASIQDTSKTPYKELIANNMLFQAVNLKGNELIKWIIATAKIKNIKITNDLANMLVEIVGEDKSLLNMHINKFADYIDESRELDIEKIKLLSSKMRKFSIFDLLNSIGDKNRERAIQVGFELIDSGEDIIQIISLFLRYLTTIARATETIRENQNKFAVSKNLGVSFYFYENCLRAKHLFDEYSLIEAGRALLEADLKVKSTSADPKTILSELIIAFT